MSLGQPDHFSYSYRGLFFTWTDGPGCHLIDVKVIGEANATMSTAGWPGMTAHEFRRECILFAREYHADCLTVEQVAAVILSGDPGEVV